MPDNSTLRPQAPPYAAVIRAYRYSAQLEELVGSLRRQTFAPSRVIIVDSSNDEPTTREFHRLAEQVVIYPGGQPFNYSKAINLGVAAALEPFVLVVSSHVHFSEAEVIEDGWKQGQHLGAGIVYWTPPTPLKSQIITRLSFDGFNGLSNACAMLPSAEVLERPFREDVFSGEDAEWSNYYLSDNTKRIMRVEDLRLIYDNPNSDSLRKLVNEHIAIAYFVRRRLLWPDRIISFLFRAAVASLRGRRDRAAMHLAIAWGLACASVRKPVANSRYF